MRSTRLCIAAILVLVGAGTVWATSLSDVIQAGADRVVATQYTDGKWGWPINVPPTYDNITGPIGLGLVSAYGVTADANHLNSAMLAGDSLVGMTADWVGTYNPMFLVKLADATGNASYLTQASSFYDDLRNGTYTRKGTDYDTAGFIAMVQAGRSGTWSNLLPWEFAPLAYAASRVGTQAQVDAFVQAIKDGIDQLDSSKYCDVLGLAGGVMGLSWMGEDFDPTAGAFAAASSTAELADMLAALQNPNGSWYWMSSLSSPGQGDEDVQTTAYAMLALLAANDSGQYDDEILRARDYLCDLQLGNGGWPSYPPDGQEYSEVNGEAIWALSDTANVPEPLTMLGVFAGIATVGGYIRRRVLV